VSEIRFEYKPLQVFIRFHQSTARHRCIIGGYGSGKSHAGVAEFQAWGLEQPGSEFLVTRKTVPALKTTTEKIFVDQLPPEFLQQCEVKKAGGHIDSIEFPNGTIYYFRGMDDWRKLRSMNLAGILYDEADEFTPEDFEGMSSRLRQTRPTAKARSLGYTRIERHGTVLACNPRGKNWIYRDFVDPQSRKAESEFFTSTTLDNPYLPVSYVNDMLAMPDPWVRAFVLCRFDDLVGAVYPEFAWDTHVIRPLKDYDPRGFFIMGFDPGTSAGNAALWCYYDKANHRLVGIAEYNETGLAASEHAMAWRKIEAKFGTGMRVRTRIADPKPIATRDRGSNVTLHEQYRRLGYNFIPGTNDINTRTTALGQLIHLRRFVVTTDCPQTFEQIKAYQWEELTPQQLERGTEAKPLKKNVDLVDAAQYIACRYIQPPKARPTGKDPEAAEIAMSIRRQLSGRRNAPIEHDLGTMRV
jgi:PBSX family phage terminase large subunit